MKDLLKLAIKYGTDKVGHGYIPKYEKYLPKNIKSLLEIGVLKGASARMFDDYYDNKPEIYLVDLFEEEGNLTEREARMLGFVPLKGSQVDLGFLSSIRRQFDLVVEDASHNSPDQLITFKHCFLNNVKSGGLYVCEDIFCSLEPFYWGGEVKCFEDTILYMFKQYLETGKIVNPYFNEGEAEVFQSLIKDVKLEDEKIIFIWKK